MFAKVLVAATLVSGVYSLTVASPASLVQCQPVQLSWSQGTAPFYVSIIPGGQPSAAALESFATTSDTQLTWVVDLSSGTSVTVKVVDSTGDTNYSSQVTIQAGSTTECSSSSGAAGAGSASAASSPSSAAATTTRAANRASSAADEVTSSAGSMVTSARSAASSVAGSVTSGIGAAAASASKSATGAASSVKASSALVGSFVAGAAMLYALA